MKCLWTCDLLVHEKSLCLGKSDGCVGSAKRLGDFLANSVRGRTWEFSFSRWEISWMVATMNAFRSVASKTIVVFHLALFETRNVFSKRVLGSRHVLGLRISAIAASPLEWWRRTSFVSSRILEEKCDCLILCRFVPYPSLSYHPWPLARK